jgi:hypothetical protein
MLAALPPHALLVFTVRSFAASVQVLVRGFFVDSTYAGAVAVEGGRGNDSEI